MDLEALRLEVREYLAERRRAGAFEPVSDAWLQGFSRPFSSELAQRGWVGMTIPERYGGPGRSALERYVVTEELLAAGAPVAAHWVAERQIAPMLLRYGSESQREALLPRIARGEAVIGLGMSEPQSGSDLAAVRTRAVRTDDGWRLRGRKVWTTHAHRADFIVVLCRTSEEADRHDGLSQLVVDTSWPGVDAQPIVAMNGRAEFSEVSFDDVLVPEEWVLGTLGRGWTQILAELGYERAGAERMLSTYPLFSAFVERQQGDAGEAVMVGEQVAELIALRALSWEVAQRIQAGEDVGVQAALAKDAGTGFEQRLVEEVRLARGRRAPIDDGLDAAVAHALLSAPTFTLRGGTSEILRGIVGRGLVR